MLHRVRIMFTNSVADMASGGRNVKAAVKSAAV